MLGDSHQSDYYQLKHFGGRLHSPFVFVLMTEKVISNDRNKPAGDSAMTSWCSCSIYVQCAWTSDLESTIK